MSTVNCGIVYSIAFDIFKFSHWLPEIWYIQFSYIDLYHAKIRGQKLPYSRNLFSYPGNIIYISWIFFELLVLHEDSYNVVEN